MNNIEITPYQRGKLFAKAGLDYNPYRASKSLKNAKEFARGFNEVLSKRQA